MISSRFCISSLFFAIMFLSNAQIEPTPKRWCNRETGVENGMFKLEPPYWQYPGCPNLPFDANATQKCMAGRTLYVMGNSVGRQSAFGMVELLGGANVKREDQRDMCPKHETTWDDSCHQEFGGVKIRYLFMQFVDGFNYTDRNGAPFWKQRVTHVKDGKNISKIKVGRLGNGKGNTPDEYNPGSYWADDNCINHRTRDCLAKFFKGSNENDVLIFTLGGSYMLDSDEEEMQKERTSTGDVIGFDKRAWLISSMLNFKAHIAAVFKGQVFRVTLAPTNKNGNIASYTPKLKEAERVMAEVLQTESVEPSHMWYTIDQWAINEGRDYLYQDHIHFNGPLTLATLHCMLNELCPGGGNKDLPNYWPSPHLQNQIITSSSSQSSLTSSSHYYIDTLGYRHSIELGPGQHPGTIPWFLLDKPIIKLPEKEIENISESNAPVPYIKEECLIRPTNNKQVYWVKDGVKRGFPSGDIFIAHGFNFGDIIVYDPWIVDLIPLGEDVKY